MTVKLQVTKENGSRIYTATVVSGKRKGEVFGPVRVIDAGYGYKVFWDKLESHFGKKCFLSIW